MMEFLLGMAGCAALLAAFGLGWCVGHGAGRGAGQACGGACPGGSGGGSCRGISLRPDGNPHIKGSPPSGRMDTPRHPPETRREAEEADEMRAAFEAVMSYNSDTAYGLNGRIGGDET